MGYNASGETMKITRRLLKPIIESILRGLVQELSLEELSHLTKRINPLLQQINPKISISPRDAREIVNSIVEWLLQRI